jgi:predicted enzyme related to lactoylglutathione lyase
MEIWREKNEAGGILSAPAFERLIQQGLGFAFGLEVDDGQARLKSLGGSVLFTVQQSPDTTRMQPVLRQPKMQRRKPAEPLGTVYNQ